MLISLVVLIVLCSWIDELDDFVINYVLTQSMKSRILNRYLLEKIEFDVGLKDRQDLDILNDCFQDFLSFYFHNYMKIMIEVLNNLIQKMSQTSPLANNYLL